MPPLERKTFMRMASGLVDDTVEFVKVRVEDDARQPVAEYIVFKEVTGRDGALRREAEKNKSSHRGSRYYADAGRISLLLDEVLVDGDPREVLDVPTMPSAKTAYDERKNTLDLVRKIVPNRQVIGNLDRS